MWLTCISDAILPDHISSDLLGQTHKNSVAHVTYISGR